MKVTVVGGGSTYTPELVDGLLRRKDALDLDEVVLVDPDAGRLSVIGPLAQRMAARSAPDVVVRWTADLADGAAGARFVVSQIRVGGMAARLRDEELGREFGLVGQETVGVGGLANALRTIPVALGIAGVVAEVAPAATLLNFTNPAGLVTEALCRHGGVPTIGLCNVPWSTKALVAGHLGAHVADVDLDTVGLNHLTWTRRVMVAGEDRTPEVLAGLRSVVSGAKGDGEPDWTPEAVDLFGAVPNYYLLYYYETAAWVRHQQATPPRASEVMKIEDQLMAKYADPALDAKPPELDQRGGAYYSEAAAALMADIASDAGTVHVVNVPNAGAVPGLPDDVVVEVAAVVGAEGARARPTEPLRPDLDALVRTMKDVELLAVRAAVEGDHEAARRALLAHPLGPAAHQVDAVWARLRELNAGSLGLLDG
ncbi:MAG: 6-phospho-beta-glucosidase [Actinomycetes bacterium]